MKKIFQPPFYFTIAICLFWSFNTQAQSTIEKYVIDSVAYVNFNDPNNLNDSSLSNLRRIVYDSLGNATIVEYTINNSSLIENTKTIVSYDKFDREVMNEQYSYNPKSKQWSGNGKTEQSFSTNGKLLEKTYFIWDNAENIWMKNNAEKNEYNFNGSIVQSIECGWVDLYVRMIDTAKTIYVRNSENKLDSIKRTHLVGTTFVNDSLVLYYRNNQGQDTTIIHKYWDIHTKSYKTATYLHFSYKDAESTLIKSKWDIASNKAIPFEKEIHTSDSYGNDTSIVYYSYNNDTWVKTYKSETAFDKNQKLLLNSSYSWTGSSWIGNTKDEASFDKNGNSISTTSFLWDYKNDKWYPSYSILNIYDAKNKIDSSYYSVWDYNDSSMIVLTRTKFHYNSEDSVYCKSIYFNPPHAPISFLVNREYIYYSTHTFKKQINDTITMKMSDNNYEQNIIYPNPAKNYIKVNLPNENNLMIYSITGKLIKSFQEVRKDDELFIGDISKGVYVLKAISNSGISSYKLIKN